jgi:hypothetical protein
MPNQFVVSNPGTPLSETAGTRPVFNQHRLLQVVLQLLSNDARSRVDRATGCNRHHQRDRPYRIALCACAANADGKRGKADRELQYPTPRQAYDLPHSTAMVINQ